MRILLDVGARNGESLGEFVKWPFDAIHAFEPMHAQYDNACAATDDPRVTVHNDGLSNETGTMTMYGSDDRGEASVYASKVDIHDQATTVCDFVRASEFFARFPAWTDIYMKLNCEGSEIAILHDLIDSGQLDRVKAFRVEFDISRCVGFEDEADRLLERLDEIGYDRYTIGSNARITDQGLVDDVPQVGTHHERLHAWLDSVWRP
jgi:FkbM family methyltransferase